MYRIAIAAVLVLAAGSARGDTVYRCVEKGKAVSFQTQPCSGAARTTAMTGYVPDRELPADVRARATQQEMDRRNAAARSSNSTLHIVEATRPNGDGISCSMAKEQRDVWERAHPLARNVDSLRWWQEFVMQHCR